MFYKICNDFESLYNEILSLCSKSDTNSGKSNDIKVESFNLNVALNLLPMITTDNECSHKQLVDNIEYYSTVLASDDCKKKLIQFVLKSRLSQHAKLQLQSDYSTIDELITDMRRVLLPQKSGGYPMARGSAPLQQQSRGAVSSRGRGQSYYRNRGNQGLSHTNNREVNVMTSAENNLTQNSVMKNSDEENQYFRE